MAKSKQLRKGKDVNVPPQRARPATMIGLFCAKQGFSPPLSGAYGKSASFPNSPGRAEPRRKFQGVAQWRAE
jgi:hypothetical protein